MEYEWRSRRCSIQNSHRRGNQQQKKNAKRKTNTTNQEDCQDKKKRVAYKREGKVWTWTVNNEATYYIEASLRWALETQPEMLSYINYFKVVRIPHNVGFFKQTDCGKCKRTRDSKAEWEKRRKVSYFVFKGENDTQDIRA